MEINGARDKGTQSRRKNESGRERKTETENRRYKESGERWHDRAGGRERDRKRERNGGMMERKEKRGGKKGG